MEEKFINYLTNKGKSKNTILAYSRDIKQFAYYIEETYKEMVDYSRIIEMDIRAFEKHLRENKVSPRSINRKLSSIQAFCKYLVAEKVLKVNPCEDVRLLEIQEKGSAPKALEEPERRKLRREITLRENKRDLAIFDMLFYAGLRVSELCNLELKDIEIGERKGAITVLGKGKKWREIPFHKDGRKSLTDYLEERKDNGDVKIFTGQRGPLTRSGVYQMLKKYGEKCGVEIHPHMLRHTFCKDLLKKGSQLPEVKTLAGHSRLDTTLLYTKPTEAELQATIDRL